jgi:hypothetical protein
MMRKAAITLSLLFVASMTVARADISNSAPADEYFGPSQQSVLEIRNRLNDFDQRDPRSMLNPEVTASLDHLEAAILDWQHRYPRDPWLPGALSHLMREYWRAGQASGDHGMAALALMRTAYPDSPATLSTVAMVYGSNPELSEISRDGNEWNQPEAPVAAAPPAPPYAAPTLPSYAIPAPVAESAPVAEAPQAPVDVPDPQPAPAPEVVSAASQSLPSYAIRHADIGYQQTGHDEAQEQAAPEQSAPAQRADDSSADPPYVAMPQDAVPTPPPTR